MRILLTHHFPHHESAVGRLAQTWAEGLVAAGHEVRLLTVDANRAVQGSLAPEVVVCNAGDPNSDLPFDVPRFASDESGAARARVTFHELSDQQLAIYREALRRRLDTLVDAFDPHVIHTEHVWVQGQLALETGVPYVLSAWGPELTAYPTDVRYQRLADQAAANAGRILVPDESVQRQVLDLFEIEPERVVLMDEALRARDARAAAEALAKLYRSLVDERFGGAA